LTEITILLQEKNANKMTRHSFFSFILFISSTITSCLISAQNWPGWRGPNGDGTSIETNLPVQWDSVTNVVWKSKAPGMGYSSPIVWNDKIFTVTALPETQEKVLLCYNGRNGELLWQ
jgi:hypothetical protein